MSWTKEEFITFCNKCGVDPAKALKEGKVSLRSTAKQTKGATISNNKQRQRNKRRRQRAIESILGIQDPERESDQAVALANKVCGQAEGMECPKVSFRICIVGHRVRPIDPDNFAAGCKGIIDGIVTSRIIPDDDWKTVEVRFSQKKVKSHGRQGTLISIESVGIP